MFELVKNSAIDCVIYCDPPYAPLLQETNFTQYAGGGFSLLQQARLANLALEMKEQGIPVLISNHDTDFTRLIYQSAQITSVQVQRSISRKRIPELKSANYLRYFPNHLQIFLKISPLVFII